MELSVVPLHKHHEYLQDCCNLINSEWKRSDTARLRSLESSCDNMPTSLILLQDKQVTGHVKISSIPSIQDACFIESVVIDRKERGKGFGTVLMKKAEEYCRSGLSLNTIYLSTKGQEPFYSKLGYVECMPISIYGNYLPSSQDNNVKKNNNINVSNTNVPVAPPMPDSSLVLNSSRKTFMKKNINSV